MKRGELTFENIFLIAFIAMFLATFFAVYQFQKNSNKSSIQGHDIITSYSYILEIIREDARFANKVEIASQSFTLFTNNDQKLKYIAQNKKFFRVDGSGNKKILLSNLQSAHFKLHPELDNLFSVRLFPESKMEIPFFTSFALRGGVQ